MQYVIWMLSYDRRYYLHPGGAWEETPHQFTLEEARVNRPWSTHIGNYDEHMHVYRLGPNFYTDPWFRFSIYT